MPVSKVAIVHPCERLTVVSLEGETMPDANPNIEPAPNNEDRGKTEMQRVYEEEQRARAHVPVISEDDPICSQA